MARNPWEVDSTAEETPRQLMPWEVGASRDTSLTGRVETAPERAERETLENQYHNMGPVRRLRAGISNAISGVPIVRDYTGNFISNPEDMDVARRAKPWLSTLERGTAGIAAYNPAARGANVIGSRVRRYLTGNRNPSLGLFGESLTQGTLGAGIGLIDRPPRDAGEALIGGLLGFGSGAVGPLGTRLLAPSGTGRPVRINPRSGDIDRTPENVRLFNRMSQREHDRIMSIPDINARTRAMAAAIDRIRGRELANRSSGFVTRYGPALTGAAFGHYFGGGLPGMIYGAAAGEAGRGIVRGFTHTRPGRRYLGHQVSPNMASLLNSVGPTLFNNLEDNPTNSATGR